MLKKYVSLLLAIGVCICLLGCGKQTLADQQIDEIIIYTSHYALTPSVVLVSITDEEIVEEIVTFFDEMEYREMTPKDTPLEDYDGGGWDTIEFRKGGKTLKQYTVSYAHICEEKPNATYFNIEASKSREEFVEKIHSRTWYIMSDDDAIAWQEYTQKARELYLGVETDEIIEQ